jgi:hypothetical protein
MFIYFKTLRQVYFYFIFKTYAAKNDSTPITSSLQIKLERHCVLSYSSYSILGMSCIWEWETEIENKKI